MRPTKFLMVLVAIATLVMTSLLMTPVAVADDGQSVLAPQAGAPNVSGSHWVATVVDTYFLPTVTGSGTACALQTATLVEVTLENLSSTGVIAPSPSALAGATTENPAPTPTLRC